VPDAFVEIINRALEYDVDKRWPSIRPTCRWPWRACVVPPERLKARHSHISSGEIEPLWSLRAKMKCALHPAISEGLLYVGSYEP